MSLLSLLVHMDRRTFNILLPKFEFCYMHVWITPIHIKSLGFRGRYCRRSLIWLEINQLGHSNFMFFVILDCIVLFLFFLFVYIFVRDSYSQNIFNIENNVRSFLFMLEKKKKKTSVQLSN